MNHFVNWVERCQQNNSKPSSKWHSILNAAYIAYVTYFSIWFIIQSCCWSMRKMCAISVGNLCVCFFVDCHLNGVICFDSITIVTEYIQHSICFALKCIESKSMFKWTVNGFALIMATYHCEVSYEIRMFILIYSKCQFFSLVPQSHLIKLKWKEAKFTLNDNI